MMKIFRVFISETQGFHHDIEANTAYHAKEQVRASFSDVEGAADIRPTEDADAYSGYQVENAIEIPRVDSDLA
jgi:hypothetical protein